MESLDLTVKVNGIDTLRKFMVDIAQVIPQTEYRRTKFHTFVSLNDNDEETFSLKVAGGYTVEVCLSQFWSSPGTSTSIFFLYDLFLTS